MSKTSHGLVRVGTRGDRKVGVVYDHMKGLRGPEDSQVIYDLYEYDCTISDHPSGRCCHTCCRIEALKKEGHDTIAKRLEGNLAARDWLRNWGLMVYDPRQHGKNSRRRQLAARLARALRDGADFAQVVREGSWCGALADCKKEEAP